MVDQIWQWKQTSLFWTMPGLQQAHFHHVSAVVDLFMQAAAFPGKHPTLGLSQNSLSADQHAAVQILVDKGYVEERQVAHGSTALFLTQDGMSAMHPARILASPTPAFAVREEVPVKDRTEYELVKELEAGGWEWRLWVPPYKRR